MNLIANIFIKLVGVIGTVDLMLDGISEFKKFLDKPSATSLTNDIKSAFTQKLFHELILSYNYPYCDKNRLRPSSLLAMFESGTIPVKKIELFVFTKPEIIINKLGLSFHFSLMENLDYMKGIIAFHEWKCDKSFNYSSILLQDDKRRRKEGYNTVDIKIKKIMDSLDSFSEASFEIISDKLPIRSDVLSVYETDSRVIGAMIMLTILCSKNKFYTSGATISELLLNYFGYSDFHFQVDFLREALLEVKRDINEGRCCDELIRILNNHNEDEIFEAIKRRLASVNLEYEARQILQLLPILTEEDISLHDSIVNDLLGSKINRLERGITKVSYLDSNSKKEDDSFYISSDEDSYTDGKGKERRRDEGNPYYQEATFEDRTKPKSKLLAVGHYKVTGTDGTFKLHDNFFFSMEDNVFTTGDGSLVEYDYDEFKKKVVIKSITYLVSKESGKLILMNTGKSDSNFLILEIKKDAAIDVEIQNEKLLIIFNFDSNIPEDVKYSSSLINNTISKLLQNKKKKLDDIAEISVIVRANRVAKSIQHNKDIIEKRKIFLKKMFNDTYFPEVKINFSDEMEPGELSSNMEDDNPAYRTTTVIFKFKKNNGTEVDEEELNNINYTEELLKGMQTDILLKASNVDVLNSSEIIKASQVFKLNDNKVGILCRTGSMNPLGSQRVMIEYGGKGCLLCESSFPYDNKESLKFDYEIYNEPDISKNKVLELVKEHQNGFISPRFRYTESQTGDNLTVQGDSISSLDIYSERKVKTNKFGPLEFEAYKIPDDIVFLVGKDSDKVKYGSSYVYPENYVSCLHVGIKKHIIILKQKFIKGKVSETYYATITPIYADVVIKNNKIEKAVYTNKFLIGPFMFRYVHEFSSFKLEIDGFYSKGFIPILSGITPLGLEGTIKEAKVAYSTGPHLHLEAYFVKPTLLDKNFVGSHLADARLRDEYISSIKTSGNVINCKIFECVTSSI